MHDLTFLSFSSATRYRFSAVVLLCLSAPARLYGQVSDVGQVTDAASPADFPVLYAGLEPDAHAAVLPDAPAPRVEISSSLPESGDSGFAEPARQPRFTPRPLAPLYNKYIEPSQRARPLTGFTHKFIFGLSQVASPYFGVAVLSSSAYEQAANASPNYGTGGDAYVQRVGAAVARDVSQSVFTDGLMPAVFHQDPRFYVMGKNHGFLARGSYAVTRVFITRTDEGKNVPNYSLFAGHAETAILQNAYYPDVNRGVSETAKGFAGSFAGVALSNSVREFLPDLLHLFGLE